MASLPVQPVYAPEIMPSNVTEPFIEQLNTDPQLYLPHGQTTRTSDPSVPKNYLSGLTGKEMSLFWRGTATGPAIPSLDSSRWPNTSTGHGDDTLSMVQSELNAQKELNADLQARLDTMSSAFQSVVTAVPSLLHVANPLNQPLPNDVLSLSNNTLPSTSEEDLSEIRFAYESDWRKFLKDNKALSGRPPLNSNAYLEDAHGQPVSTERASFVRGTAQHIWATLKNRGLAPVTWGKVTFEANEFFKREMARTIPEMRLCHDSWKATYLATHHYPSWYTNHIKKSEGVKVKEEPKDTKRPADEDLDEERQFKKVKVDDCANKPTPPSEPFSSTNSSANANPRIKISNGLFSKATPVSSIKVAGPVANLTSDAANPATNAAEPGSALTSATSTSTTAPIITPVDTFITPVTTITITSNPPAALDAPAGAKSSSKRLTPRQSALSEWQKKNPDGSTAQFNAYWKDLKDSRTNKNDPSSAPARMTRGRKT